MNNKRVLLVTQYFYPENFKSNDIAFELSKRGYKVDVLTGIPNYPEGKIYKGYGYFLKRKEVINNVNVYRALQFPRGHKSKLKLLLNYFSFAIFGSLYAIFLGITKKKYDKIIVHQPSPITQSLPSLILKYIFNIPIYIWVLDIWPDAMISGGGVKSKRIYNIVNCFVNEVYKKSDKILISSMGFKDLVNRNNDYTSKIIYFPNWSADMQKINSTPQNPPFFPKGFVIMMAGNLGSAQRLESVIKCVNLLKKNENIKWVFVGDGSYKDYIEDFRKKHNLENIIYTTGRMPQEYMPWVFSRADALLITMKDNFPHLNAVVPARLQSYMSAGKPILAMANGGIEKLVKEADCGYVVSADNYIALANIIKQNVLPNIEEFRKLGANGRKYYLQNFSKLDCIDNLENIMLK